MNCRIPSWLSPQLAAAALALVTDAGPAGLTTNKGAHGLSEILVAYTTSMANNGQNFAGLSANTPLFAVLTSTIVLVVDALSYLPVLARGPIVEHLALR